MNNRTLGFVELKEALLASGLGTDLTDEELHKVGSSANEVLFTKGMRILEEGSKSRDLFVVLEGEVSVLIDFTVVQKFEERVARMGAGEIFGEFAFLSDEARSASIQAETACRLLQLDHSTLAVLFEAEPAIGYKFVRNIAGIVTARIAEQQKLVRRLLFN